MSDVSNAMILVVDDEPNNVELLVKRLKFSGYQTLQALNGPDAIKLAVDNQPDLIILDVMMPGMGGYEVCKNLKSNSVTRDIPVLFLSAKAEVDDRVEGLEIGAVDYITKPFHPRELEARIVNALKQRSALQKIKDEYDKLQAISIVDELTGLYNRRYFMERFVEEMNRAKRYKYPISCLMIDVDYFKQINDRFGHLTGDKVLAEIALTFKNFTRVVDLVARYGGEEFVVLLPQTDLSGAMIVAEKIREKLAETDLTVEDQIMRITVSIGIGVYYGEGASGGTIQDLLSQADQALYQAKRSGRNQTCVYSSVISAPPQDS
ncbi:MAG: diguanylate cyclase [Candidatus Saccharibacteria bacterium]